MWRFTEELFDLSADEQQLVQDGVIPNITLLKEQWQDIVNAEAAHYGLNIPELGAYRRGAKQGLHTEHLGYVLAEMQYMQRSYPNMNW